MSRSTRAVRASVLAVAAVTALTGAGITAVGLALTPGGEDAGEEAALAAGVTFALTPTPADAFMDALAADITATWDTTGWVQGAKAPHPLGCGSLVDPVRSFSTTVASGHQAQLYAAVYPAGMGAAELEAQVQGAEECASTSSRTLGELGAEAFEVASRWSGMATTTQAWRHGDVVLYVASDDKSAFATMTSEVDAMATKHLSECLQTDSSVADALRSPLHAGYQGWLVDLEVTIPEPEKTDATDLPDPLPLEEVDLPQERAYPVWPLLPAPVQRPADPDRPQWPDTSTVVSQQQQDPAGPGCGWAFTGQEPPVFNEQEIAAANARVVDEARSALQAGVESWREAIKGFWAQWPQHVRAAEAYAQYAEQVADVEAAWAPIDAQWSHYYSLYGQYEDDVDRYTRTLARRQEASDWYEAEAAKCELATQTVAEADAALEAEPGDDATPATGPDDQIVDDSDAAPSITQEPEDVLRARATLASCPPVRPTLLDELEPVAPVAPTPPPDPTPAGGERS